jgi:hypothetical protein
MERAPVREGFIVLTNGDTLKGFIKVFPNAPEYYPILDTASNRIQNVIVERISSMRIYHYPDLWPYYNNSPKGPYVDYIKLPSTDYLWMLVGKKNDVAIYDDEVKGGTNELILVTLKTRITLYKGGIWLLSDNLGLLLIQFINQRYKTGVQSGDFKAMRQIFDYILDKENSLSSQ